MTERDDSPKHSFNAPPEQQAIRDKCLHPQGAFVEFSMEDVETPIPVSFEINRVPIPGLHGDQSLGEATTENDAQKQLARKGLRRSKEL